MPVTVKPNRLAFFISFAAYGKSSTLQAVTESYIVDLSIFVGDPTFHTMALSHPSNRLRALRKRLTLSQNQLAFLLGVGSGSKISRYERCLRNPGLTAMLALEVIFQKPGRELFARLYREVQKSVAVRARLLNRKMQIQNPLSVSQTQRETLARLINETSKPTEHP